MSFLTGKVVLITGAGKGVGRRLAEALAARGATLAVNDLTPINLDETVARIAAAGGQVQPYLADIAKKLPVQGLLNRVLDNFSRLDVLVNCAQVEPRKSVYEMDEWDWQRTLDVNLTGAFLLTQSAGRIMKEKGGGTIVHLGVRPGGPGPDEGRAAYLAAKAGLEALVKAAANEFAQFGVCVYHVVTAEAALEVIEP